MHSSLGSVCAVIGAQWGDEGKGKAIDILTEQFDIIARASGGANAGHTIVVHDEKHVFHLVPSGCLHEGKPIILGAGMVIHLPTLLEEIQILRDAGIDIVPRLHIAKEAHILFEFHKAIDGAQEEKRTQKIGTTKRGIGPAYADKIARAGIRMEMLSSIDAIMEKLKSRAVELQGQGIAVDLAQEQEALTQAQAIVGSCVHDDISSYLADAVTNGKTVLLEGAQGTLLDIDHGTYPFVTSSNTTAGGALNALGMKPQSLTSCVGIAKAYCTRVGEGDFPTEAEGETAERLRERGGEYGATTGRPRRTGWLHLPDLQKAARLNGITHWNLTKMDVLDEEDIIYVGTDLQNGKAVYTELPGWKTSTAGITAFADLPENAQKFVTFVEEQTGVPASFIGTGPQRHEMITRL